MHLRCLWGLEFLKLRAKGNKFNYNSSKWEISRWCFRDSSRCLISSKLSIGEIRLMAWAPCKIIWWLSPSKVWMAWTILMMSISTWTKQSQILQTKILEMISKWFQICNHKSIDLPRILLLRRRVSQLVLRNPSNQDQELALRSPMHPLTPLLADKKSLQSQAQCLARSQSPSQPPKVAASNDQDYQYFNNY